MEIRELQRIVTTLIDLNHSKMDFTYRLLDLNSEIGKLSKITLNSAENNAFLPNQEWAIRMGNVLVSLVSLANITNVDLEEALQDVLRKYDSQNIN